MSTAFERKTIYSTSRWRKLRARVLRRDGGLCRRCHQSGIERVADEVHHLRPVRAGGAIWDTANLVSLCRQCHRERHETKIEAARRQWRAFAKELLTEDSQCSQATN